MWPSLQARSRKVKAAGSQQGWAESQQQALAAEKAVGNVVGQTRAARKKGKSVSAEKGGEKTTINHGNGEKTTVTSDKEGSRIERHGTNESTRESHKEALDRITREAEARGEKADIQRK